MAFGSSSESSHFDGNQVASLVVVQGTLGTADVGGTAHTVAVGGDPLTGAMYVNNIGTSASVNINSGTINVGTFNNTGTNVNIVTGTFNVGSVAITNAPNVNVQSGTQQTLGTVGVVNNLATGTIAAATLVGGTFQAGTVTNLGTFVNVSTGTQQTLGTVGVVNNIVTGTLANSGTTTGVGVVTALTSGSVTMQVGTLTTGTLQNLNNGTLALVTTVSNLTNGTVNVNTGTITTIAAGSQNTLGTVGVINGGTISVSPIPTITQPTFGTHGTTGVSVFGTLAGGTSSGAGTEIFVTSVSVSLPSTAGSQDVSVGWGTNGGTFQAGTGLIVRGNFLAGGGIQKTFSPAINSGTNAQLCYFQAGAGTVDINVTYFTIASTL